MILHIVFLSTFAITMFVQPVASLDFEFTGTEKYMGFQLDDDDDTDEMFYNAQGRFYTYQKEKECPTISEYNTIFESIHTDADVTNKL